MPNTAFRLGLTLMAILAISGWRILPLVGGVLQPGRPAVLASGGTLAFVALEVLGWHLLRTMAFAKAQPKLLLGSAITFPPAIAILGLAGAVLTGFGWLFFGAWLLGITLLVLWRPRHSPLPPLA